MAKRRKQPRRLSVHVVARPDGTRALEVGGVTQSVVPTADGEGGTSGAVAGYWAAMLPERCPRRVALLGLGGGTVARLLAAHCPGVEMLGIEGNEAVLATARGALGLDDVPGLTALLADAFAWVPEAAEQEPGSYDLVCLDLFEAGRLARGALATPFLRQVARLLSADGALTVNLMVTGRLQEQLHRLQRVYRLERSVRVRGNLVLELRPLPADAPGAGVADLTPVPAPTGEGRAPGRRGA